MTTPKNSPIPAETAPFHCLPFSAQTLISLADMQKFFTHGLIFYMQVLEAREAFAREQVEINGCGLESDKPYRENVMRAIAELRKYCVPLKLSTSLDRMGMIEARFLGMARNRSCAYEIIAADIEGALNAIRSELAGRHFAYLPTEKAAFFEKENLFGESVTAAFPLAAEDVKSSGNCLAADLHTASVFHCLRAAEKGLRVLAVKLGLSKIGREALDQVTLGALIVEVERKIEAKIDALKPKKGLTTAPKSSKRGQARQKLLLCCRGLLTDFRYVKEADRDPISHARKDYTEPGALDVFERVRDLMQRMAEAVKLL